MRWLILLVALSVLGLAPSPTRAHAVLLASNPADGAGLGSAPGSIELRFSEPVTPVAIRLVRQGGPELADPVAEVADEVVTIRLPVLASGRYFLGWRVTSLDSHPIGGTLRFGVGMDAAGAEDVAAADPTVAWLAFLLHATHILLTLVVAGGALAIVLLPVPAMLRDQLRSSLETLALTLLGVIVLRFAVAGAALAGLPLDAILTAPPWRIALAQPIGRALALAGLGVAMLILGFRGQLRSSLLAIGSAAMLLAFGLTGHVASASPRPAMAAALVAHATMAAFWVGSLLPLRMATPHGRAMAVPLLERFSFLASGAVALLVVLGVAISVVQLGEPAALLSTAYGARLLAKLVLVAAMLGVAALSRWWLVPALRAGSAMAAPRLRLVLGLDLLLAMAVALATATMSLGGPPRIAAPAEPIAQRVWSTYLAAGNHGLVLSISPGAVGRNRVEAVLTDAGGLPFDAREVTIVWSARGLGIEPLRQPMRFLGNGNYLAQGIELVASGRWQIQVQALVDDFTRADFTTELVLP